MVSSSLSSESVAGCGSRETSLGGRLLPDRPFALDVAFERSFARPRVGSARRFVRVRAGGRGIDRAEAVFVAGRLVAAGLAAVFPDRRVRRADRPATGFCGAGFPLDGLARPLSDDAGRFGSAGRVLPPLPADFG
jgi:hypothetical protein